MSTASIEKRLTLEALERGNLRFTEREADALGLPEYSEDLVCRVSDEEFPVHWRAGGLEVTGDELADALSIHGQAGGYVRVQRSAQLIELQFIAAPTSFLRPPPTPPPKPERSVRRRRDGRRLRSDRFRVRDDSEFEWSGVVGVHRAALDRLGHEMVTGGWDPRDLFELRLEGERLAAVSTFDELLAVDVSRIDHMPHQEATALKVLRQMHGRAILADEVGLGKTIEAGLIMKELMLRGLAQRVLVLCPASLRDQWRGELLEKFEESFDVVTTGGPIRGDRVVMSVQLARNHMRHVAGEPWDLVILDEAHKGIGGPRTRELIGALDTRYMLFLTATPVQNRLTELYNLVELLRPGTFASEPAFRRRFVDPNNEREPVDAAGLRRLVADVMVRTTREQVGIDHIRRYAVDMPIDLSKAEREVYQLCTDGLRTIMTDTADGLRRRNLAHRLTASPRSLALTARRIAQSHPDDRVCQFLTELSDLAIGFGVTTRQRRLLSLLEDWTGDRVHKGQVLVFTQHSDTLEDILRILAEADLEATAFHGGMSPSARRQSIERFRSGVPVMVATEAGAEGLNLQFANCVVNYDLPWNPMRIEQRIGRVHRLTQTRDVHVANFYAKGTIDEHVYRLLHDKLRMFELLFGQITTILGEIEVGGDETFESRVLSAYLSADDEQMRAQIEALGTKVEKAYESAQDAVRAQGGLSAWAADRGYRDGIDSASATELRPLAEARVRDRQARVGAFVRHFLALTGCEIILDEETFVSARVPAGLTEHFGGREEIHLSFDAAGLDLHRDAELCAVGSEVFEEIVTSLRELGDLHATLPPEPLLDQAAWVDHDDGLELIERVVLGPIAWSGRAVWRVQSSGTDLGEDVVVTEVDRPDIIAEREAVDLAQGDRLPETLGGEEAILDRIVELSRPALQEVADLVQTEIHERVAQETERVNALVTEQIPELQRRAKGWGNDADRAKVDLERLERMQAEAIRREVPISRVRSELMAVEVLADRNYAIRESWLSEDGRVVVLEATWRQGQRGDTVEYRDPTGAPIRHLTLCHEGHPVDVANAKGCPGCGKRVCATCRTLEGMRHCRACGVEYCGDCLVPERAVCQGCAEPERETTQDHHGLCAWRVGGEAVVWVGERTATIERSDGSRISLVPHGDLHDTARVRAREVAGAIGARLDLGVELLRLTEDVELPPLAIPLNDERTVMWSVVPLGGSMVDGDATWVLPDDLCHVEVLGERSCGLEDWLAELRERHAPDCAPMLRARQVRKRSFVTPVANGLSFVELTETGGEPARRNSALLDFVPATRAADHFATAAHHGYEFRLARIHRSLLLDISDPDGDGGSWFIPADHGVDERSERAAERLIERLGLPPGSLLGINEVAALPVQFAEPDPAAVVLIDRTVEPDWGWHRGVGRRAVGVADNEVLQFEGESTWAVDLGTVGFEGLFDLASELRDEPVAEFTLVRRARLAETWRGNRQVSRERVVAPGEPAFPVLDDTGVPAADFGIDDLGHLHVKGGDWECFACERMRCRACGEAGLLGTCAACGQDACGDCRLGPGILVKDENCELCGSVSCSGCGRELAASSCVICARSVCKRCRKGDVCAGCDQLADSEPTDGDGLPAELHANGIQVRVHAVGPTVVAALVGRHRREIAVMRDGVVTKWITDRGALPLEQQASFAASAHFGIPADLGVEVTMVRTPGITGPSAWKLAEVRSVRADWGVTDGSVLRLRGAPISIPEEDADPLAALTRELGATGWRTPEPATSEEESLMATLLVGCQSPRADRRLVVTATEVAKVLRLDQSGLVAESHAGGETESRRGAWNPGDRDGSESRPNWFYEPDLVTRCALLGVEVELARFGGGVAVAIRTSGDWKRYSLEREGSPFDGAALCDRIGVPRVEIGIGRFLGPDEFSPLEVAGAHLVERTVEPKTWPALGVPYPNLMSNAVRAWLAPDLPEFLTPAAEVMPEALVSSLRQVVIPDDFPSLHFDLGVSVVERWQWAGGERTVSYDVSPLTGPSFLSDDTNESVMSVSVDRSGHFAVHVDGCPYCRTGTCQTCDDAVSACAICGIPVCGRCSRRLSDLRVCGACGALEPIGRLRRALLREVDGLAMAGRDSLHHVTVERRDQGANLLVQGGGGLVPEGKRPLSLTNELCTALNARLGRSEFVADADGGVDPRGRP